MYPRRDDRSKLYGYWARGGWIITPRFSYASPFCSGFAPVETSDGARALITKDGSMFRLDALCGGRELYAERGERASFVGFEPDGGGLAEVCVDDGGRRGWGLLDLDLNYTPLPGEIFADIDQVQVCGKRLVVRRRVGDGLECLCGLYNLEEGRLELPVAFASIDPSAEGFWATAEPPGGPRGDDRYAFYDPAEKRRLPGWFRFAKAFSEGYGTVHVGGWDDEGRSFFVDRGLQPAFDAEFDQADHFSHGLAAVYDEDAGYLDASGRMRLVLPYDKLGPFNRHGLALVNRDEAEWDIDVIDRSGRARLRGLETADYVDGDHPYFEVTIGGETRLIAPDLETVF